MAQEKANGSAAPSSGTTGTSPKEASHLSLTDRLKHFTWANFTFPMSTGGLALLLGSQPHTFRGLLTIGKVVYIFDLCIFLTTCILITVRFTKHPNTFKPSITYPTESLFVPCAFLSAASIITAIHTYGIPATGPWLITTYEVLFWLYFALTFALAVAQYLFLFARPQFTIQGMVPSWILPIFPFMLCGTISSAGAPSMSPARRIPVIVAGLTAQGLGMLVAFLMYAQYVRRLLQFGPPSPNMRPGMFISVGPPAFTSLALIGLAEAWPSGAAGAYFGDPVVTQQVVRIMATLTGCFIWCLAFWFFAISVLACAAAAREMTFHLSWWAFVFPNVGFTIAVIRIGGQFESQGVLWVGSAMTVVLVLVYLFVLVAHIRAVVTKQIIWPGKDEDAQHSDPEEHKGKGVDEEAKMRKTN